MRKLLKTLSSLLLAVFFLFTHAALAQEGVTAPPTAPGNTATESKTETQAPDQEKVIYEYKKEDYFDFEALSVKGDLLTPGDLSSKAVKRVKFNSKDYVRKNFDDYIEDDLMEIY